MKPLPPTKPISVMATAVLSITLMSFATTVSTQASGGPGPRGPRMDRQQMGKPHIRGAPMGAYHQLRHAERMTRLFDTDSDGKITLAEINADQARMFTALDVDGDKSMSVDEIRRRGRSLQIFRTTTLFDLLDTDGDGKLSVAEVQAPSKRWFKRYDKNANGIMEAEEIPEGRRRGRR